MKVTFIYPRFEKFLSTNTDLDKGLIDYFLGDFTTPPSLGIPILASLTPPDVEIEFIDDNTFDPIDFSAHTDLVAINCFTPQATRAFEIGDGYRAHGTKVIMGGFFPSFMVDECLKHSDSVNVGEGEPTWLQILADAKTGNLQKVYQGGSRFDLSNMKIPRRDIFYSKKSYDWDEDLVQLSRGCSYACAMCAIPAHMGGRIRFRPIDQVVTEIASLKYENVYLADDTLFFPQRKLNDYARELFKALIPLNKKYFVSSTMALNIDTEFLDLAAKAGVRNFYCTMNVDPVSIRAIQGSQKEIQQLIDLAKILEDREIRFFASIGVGRDWDDGSIGERVVTLLDKANIHTAEFFLFTPYPGSVQWDRMESQGRIFDKTWKHYNGAHVVADPYGMSAEKLYEQFIFIWKEFFKMQKDVHAASLEPSTFKNGLQVVGKPLEKKKVSQQAVITGTGIISAIGHTESEILKNLHAGKSGIKPITKFDTSHFRTNLGGEITDFDPLAYCTKEEIATYEDLYLLYAISAARLAIADAGLSWQGRTLRRDIALVLGSCNGGLLSAEAEYGWKHGKNDRGFDEKMNQSAQFYGFGKALSGALGIGGDVWIVATACSSATGAIGLAQNLIRKGYYQTVIVGGSDSLCLSNMAGFDSLKATGVGQTSPFSLPVGLNIGEGAAFWILESMEQALLRKASIKGKVAGNATSCDAYHPTSPDPRGGGAFLAMQNAVLDSTVPLEKIGCINAHGTGTEANDRAESKAIGRLIGDLPIPAVSTKSFFGHCMGATGILEATCNLYAMNKNFIPPTINFTEPRPGCTLDYVPNVARDTQYNAFLSANYAFGGNNAAVVVTKWDTEISVQEQKNKRVVITGVGAACSLGTTLDTILEKLRSREVSIGSASSLKVKTIASAKAGLMNKIVAADVDRKYDVSQLNPISSFAVTSAYRAAASACLKINPRNADTVGIAMGVCNGPSEMGHMDSVFTTKNYAADLATFPNITANSTAGWVANMLCCKGANTSLATGPHAGLCALAYAYDTMHDEKATAMFAAASDEVYAQTFYNYDLIGFLYADEKESDYRIHLDEPKKKVIGEGSGTLLLETLDSAQSRTAPILGEVLGYGMSSDAGAYAVQNLDVSALVHAIHTALARAAVAHAVIDCIAWAPQGNAQDKKMLDALDVVFGSRAQKIPLVTTTFNTGFIESASILVTLAALLAALAHDDTMVPWPQITGIPEIDTRTFEKKVDYVLAIGSSDVGGNYAVVIKTGKE